MSLFKKATREAVKLKIGLVGTAGSGKTYSALLLAKGLVEPPYEGKIAVVDTENGSAALYGDIVPFDVLALDPPFDVSRYTDAIKEATEAGYEVIILDSISHAWAGTGGLLDQKDKVAKVEKNSFTAWREVSKKHAALIDAMLQSDIHLIATMRAKTEYALVPDDKGKMRPQKLGMAPIQREGMDYEFSIVFDIDREEHLARASKDRTGVFGDDIFTISEETGRILQEWRKTGAKVEPKPVTEFKKPATSSPPAVDVQDEIGKFYKEYLNHGWKAAEIKEQWTALTNKTSTKEYTIDDLKLIEAHAAFIEADPEVLLSTGTKGNKNDVENNDEEVA